MYLALVPFRASFVFARATDKTCICRHIYIYIYINRDTPNIYDQERIVMADRDMFM